METTVSLNENTSSITTMAVLDEQVRSFTEKTE